MDKLFCVGWVLVLVSNFVCTIMNPCISKIAFLYPWSQYAIYDKEEKKDGIRKYSWGINSQDDIKGEDRTFYGNIISRFLRV